MWFGSCGGSGSNGSRRGGSSGSVDACLGSYVGVYSDDDDDNDDNNGSLT